MGILNFNILNFEGLPGVKLICQNLMYLKYIKFPYRPRLVTSAFKAKNNAQTTSEQLQTNFQKVQKTTFLAPKMVKSRVPILKKWRKFHPKISILVVTK